MLPEPIQVTLKVVDAFNHLEIAYLIGGSLASAVYGIVRSTMDADLVADVRQEHVQPLKGLIEDEFNIDPEMILDAIQHRTSFNLIHLETLFKVDVFILKQRPFDLNQMKRRVLQNVGGSPAQQVFFSTAEDIILAKLEWFRSGGEVSDHQWRDIMGVLHLQFEQLDLEYLRKWARSLGVSDLLQRALMEANINK